MSPKDHTTVYTCIERGRKICRDANQEILVMTADLAIYKLMVDIRFYHTPLLIGMVSICGGIHWLMDFVSCVGTLGCMLWIERHSRNYIWIS